MEHAQHEVQYINQVKVGLKHDLGKNTYINVLVTRVNQTGMTTLGFCFLVPVYDAIVVKRFTSSSTQTLPSTLKYTVHYVTMDTIRRRRTTDHGCTYNMLYHIIDHIFSVA